MLVYLRLVCVSTLASLMALADPEPPRPEPWNGILSLMEESTAQGSPRLIEHLESLTPEQMLLAARQACEEVERRAAEMRDMPPSEVAKLYVMTCLFYYLEGADNDQRAKKLLAIAGDPKESALLRGAILARLGDTPETLCERTLQIYVQGHRSAVDAMLKSILEDRSDNVIVRTEAMYALTWFLEQEVTKIALADSNVHAVWERTHEAVPIGKLLRSGELTLTEETAKALKVIEPRIVANITLLGSVACHDKNQPEELRERAKRTLKGYKTLPFPELDEGIDKALQQLAD